MRHFCRARAGRAQLELLRHRLIDAAESLALLNRAGEVKAPEHRLKLVRVLFEQRGQERPQRGLDGGEFERERQNARRQALPAVERHRGQHLFGQAFAQFVKVLVELLHHIGLLLRIVGQGRAPDLAAFALVVRVEEGLKARDQVGLGEQHVHRRKDLQRLGQLLHALAQVLGQLDGGVRSRTRQLGHADSDDHAVDGCLAAVLLEQRQKGHPFAAVLFMQPSSDRPCPAGCLRW